MSHFLLRKTTSLTLTGKYDTFLSLCITLIVKYMKVIQANYGVTLREWQEEDIAAYAALVSDPEVMRYISGGKVRAYAKAQAEIESFSAEIADRGWSRWAIAETQSNQFIGYVGFASHELGLDLGGRALQKYWGSVYTYIAFFLAIQTGFERFGFEHFFTLTHVKNWRAIRMNEKFLCTQNLQYPVVQTPYGPHLKIDYTRDRYQQVKGHNLARLEKFYRRIA